MDREMDSQEKISKPHVTLSAEELLRAKIPGKETGIEVRTGT